MQLGLALPFGDIGGDGPAVREFCQMAEAEGYDGLTLADHVLARFESEEAPGIADAVTRAADAIETWIADGLARVMNTYNRSEDN